MPTYFFNLPLLLTMVVNGTSLCNQPPAHILVLPYPAQGHTLPLLDFLHQLLLRFNHHITIITTPKNLTTVSPLLAAHPSAIQTLTLPFPSHPAIPAGVENVKDLGNKSIVHVVSAWTQLGPLISKWFFSVPNRPVALIYDFFLGWSAKLAQEFSIPHFAFYSSGGFTTAVVEYCWILSEEVREKEVYEFGDLPGSPSFHVADLPSLFLKYDKSSPDWNILKESLSQNATASGCIFNSSEALEKKYLDFLKEKRGGNKIYAVGPISLNGLNQTKEPPDSTTAETLQWLDKFSEGSVLYVCFGSQKFMTEEQMNGLAVGLEKSGSKFVWVLKNGNLPDGFEERVSGRGLVIKGWAPQQRILTHAAVGGFLSHCGWNSLLEGIEAGVMFLTWPMEADQYVNAKLVEDDLRVALRVCKGGDSVPDPDTVAEVIKLWSSDEGREWKDRALLLKEEAVAGVAEGGSSSIDLDRLGMSIVKKL